MYSSCLSQTHEHDVKYNMRSLFDHLQQNDIDKRNGRSPFDIAG